MSEAEIDTASEMSGTSDQGGSPDQANADNEAKKGTLSKLSLSLDIQQATAIAAVVFALLIGAYLFTILLSCSCHAGRISERGMGASE